MKGWVPLAMPTQTSEMMEYALAYAELYHWRVFPITPDEKVPLGRLVPHGCKDGTTDLDQIALWWEAEPTANVGVATGSGLVVLDVDGEAGKRSLDAIREQIGDLPTTFTVGTGGGGLHFYMAVPEEHDQYRNAARYKGWDGIDIRGDGGYVVAPPSTHKSGRRYELIEPSPDLCESVWLDRIPQVEAEKARQPAPAPTNGARSSISDAYVRSAMERELGKLAQAAEGQRNDQLNRSAFALGQLVGAGALDRHAVASELLLVASRTGLPMQEAEVTIRSGLDSGERQPRNMPPARTAAATGTRADDPRPTPPRVAGLTDVGNAHRLARKHGVNIRFCEDRAHWLLWDGTRWDEDRTRRIFGLAKDTVFAIRVEAANTDEEDKRKAVSTWAHRSQEFRRVTAMIELAKDEVAIRPEDLDKNDWLLNCENGTVDLRTGALLPHDREHHITKLAPVSYDAAATCPRWMAFLERVLPDHSVRAFVQRAVGYSLTGSTSEQVMFILFGVGCNGKSTFLETIGEMMGDYRLETPTSTLLATREDQDGPRNDVARLKGARLVTAMEAEEGRRLHESRVKELCGGDTVTARFLHREFFQFQPTHKLWLRANHKPVVRGSDMGIWRRIRLVPFLVTIEDDEKDPELSSRLRTEVSGILTWAVEGALEWQRRGLSPPPGIEDATSAYRSEMDVLGAFLEECCVADDRSTVSSGELYASYRQWCETNGEYVANQTTMGRRLTERGFANFRLGNGRKAWRGLKLSEWG
jgi:putative DNA primase/helicase